MSSITSLSARKKKHKEAVARPHVSIIKPLMAFVCRVLLIYALLMAPWPGLEEAYRHLFSVSNSFLLGSFGSEGIVYFEPILEPTGRLDTMLTLTNHDQLRREDGLFGVAWVSSRYSSYMAIAFVMALILSTPIPTRRQAWALLWGLLLIHGFVIFKLTILILCTYKQHTDISPFVFSPFWANVLDILHTMIANNFNLSLLIPVPIWILVSFRSQEWEMILQKLDSSNMNEL